MTKMTDIERAITEAQRMRDACVALAIEAGAAGLIDDAESYRVEAGEYAAEVQRLRTLRAKAVR